MRSRKGGSIQFQFGLILPNKVNVKVEKVQISYEKSYKLVLEMRSKTN